MRKLIFWYAKFYIKSDCLSKQFFAPQPYASWVVVLCGKRKPYFYFDAEVAIAIKLHWALLWLWIVQAYSNTTLLHTLIGALFKTYDKDKAFL